MLPFCSNSVFLQRHRGTGHPGTTAYSPVCFALTFGADTAQQSVDAYSSMPFTPFHFGPGAAIHAVAPKHVSFLAFCAVNILIDVEPLYYMLSDQYPIHRFFHTYIGATVVAATTVIIFTIFRWFASRWCLPDLFRWQALTVLAVTLGAVTGTYSHIVLDSLMHHDIMPFAPFSNANPLLQAVSLSTLNWSCLAAGVAGLCLLGVRRMLSKGQEVQS